MLIALLLGSYQSIYAESNDSKSESKIVINSVADMESANMKNDLEKWTDQKMIGELSKIDLTDNDIKALYVEFKNTIVDGDGWSKRFSTHIVRNMGPYRIGEERSKI